MSVVNLFLVITCVSSMRYYYQTGSFVEKNWVKDANFLLLVVRLYWAISSNLLFCIYRFDYSQTTLSLNVYTKMSTAHLNRSSIVRATVAIRSSISRAIFLSLYGRECLPEAPVLHTPGEMLLTAWWILDCIFLLHVNIGNNGIEEIELSKLSEKVNRIVSPNSDFAEIIKKPLNFAVMFGTNHK